MYEAQHPSYVYFQSRPYLMLRARASVSDQIPFVSGETYAGHGKWNVLTSGEFSRRMLSGEYTPVALDDVAAELAACDTSRGR